MSTFSQLWPLDVLVPGIFIKNVVAYKQVTEVLPDTKRALLRGSVLESGRVLDYRAQESQSKWKF